MEKSSATKKESLEYLRGWYKENQCYPLVKLLDLIIQKRESNAFNVEDSEIFGHKDCLIVEQTERVFHREKPIEIRSKASIYANLSAPYHSAGNFYITYSGSRPKSIGNEYNDVKLEEVFDIVFIQESKQ